MRSSHQWEYYLPDRLMQGSRFRILRRNCILERPGHVSGVVAEKLALTRRRPKIEVIRHVKLNAQRRPITSTRRPKPNAPTLIQVRELIENDAITYARPALAHAQMLPLSTLADTQYAGGDTHYEPGGTPISWLPGISTVR